MKGEEAKNFFKYLKEHSAQSELTKSIEEKVNFAKKNMTWRKQYMTWEQTIEDEKEDAYEEGLEDGRAEGASQKAMEAAENLLREGIPMETVSRCIDLPLEKVQKMAEQLRMHT